MDQPFPPLSMFSSDRAVPTLSLIMFRVGHLLIHSSNRRKSGWSRIPLPYASDTGKDNYFLQFEITLLYVAFTGVFDNIHHNRNFPYYHEQRKLDIVWISTSCCHKLIQKVIEWNVLIMKYVQNQNICLFSFVRLREVQAYKRRTIYIYVSLKIFLFTIFLVIINTMFCSLLKATRSSRQVYLSPMISAYLRNNSVIPFLFKPYRG